MATPPTVTSSGLPFVPSSPIPIPLGGNLPPVPQDGIAGGVSSLTRSRTDSDSPFPSLVVDRSNSNGGRSPVESLALSRHAPVPVEPPSPSKVPCTPDPADPPSGSRVFSDGAVPMKISRIFQRFLVRMPHTFIAIAGTFVPLYYGLGLESLAYSASTFVGVGGTVYCLVRAIFIEVIPEWMLPRNDGTKIWRRLMNVTYTGFITVIFTTAVWKLPDLSSTQGLFFFGVSFGAPYVFLAKLYPDIDKQPTWSQQRNG